MMREALTIVAAVFALSSAKASAQEDRPAGPPWTDVCRGMESEGFRAVFKSDACEADFQAAFTRGSVDEARAWMAENRRRCVRDWDHFSWLAFARNDAAMATLAFQHQLELVEEKLGARAETLLERGVSGEIGEAARRHTLSFLDVVEQNQSFKEKMDKAYSAVTPVCSYHLNVECIGAMNKVLTWMYPRSYRSSDPDASYFSFSMVPFYRDVFTDTATQRAASRLALDLLHAVEAGGAGAVDELLPLGLAAFEGDADRFWKFMVVYATRGAAWASASALVHQDNAPLFAAFMVVSAAMGWLDTAYAHAGKAWSYGKDATATCFQPKPYHYWMAAGYAYLLRKEGYSARTARLVPRLLGAMYELGSTTTGRQPEEVFFLPTFHQKVNRTRREVAHHYLGAELGVRFPAQPTQDFDAALATLMDASEPLPDVSDDEMRRRIEDPMTRWKLWSSLMGYYAAGE